MCNCSFGAIILAVLMLKPVVSNGQVQEDFGLWATLAFNKDVSKNTDVSIYQEFRMEDNAQILGRSFTNLGIDYKVKKWFRLGLNYRFILNRRDNGTYGQRHRAMGDIVLRSSVRRFNFSYRARLQWEVRGVNYQREFGFTPAYDFRNTGKVSYKWNRKLEPYFSLDIRFLLRDPNTPYLQGFDRHRVVAGMEINLAAKRTLEVFMLTSRDWNVVEPNRLYVIGCQFTFGSSTLFFGS